jgi:hypothetical protein
LSHIYHKSWYFAWIAKHWIILLQVTSYVTTNVNKVEREFNVWERAVVKFIDFSYTFWMNDCISPLGRFLFIFSIFKEKLFINFHDIFRIWVTKICVNSVFIQDSVVNLWLVILNETSLFLSAFWIGKKLTFSKRTH